jgi:hypothetical protein
VSEIFWGAPPSNHEVILERDARCFIVFHESIDQGVGVRWVKVTDHEFVTTNDRSILPRQGKRQPVKGSFA